MSEVPKATFVWLPHLGIYLGTHPLHSQALPSVCVPRPQPQPQAPRQWEKSGPEGHTPLPPQLCWGRSTGWLEQHWGSGASQAPGSKIAVVFT